MPVPILKMAEAAERGSVRLDDSMRGVKSANDELSFRYDPSNAMLYDQKPARRKLATGVPHDVENVLNSTDVSAKRVFDRIPQSNVAELVRDAEQMEKRSEDLGPFACNAPKGNLVPVLPKRLADPMTDERADASKEFNLPYVPVAVDV